MPEQTENTLDVLGAYFITLGEVVRLFGRDGLAPDLGTSWSQDLGDGISVRHVTLADGDQVFQASFDDEIRLDVRTDTTGSALWESVETRFDADGTLSSQQIVQDIGTIREDFYEGGQRVAIRYTDTSANLAWTDITNFYDASGTRTEKLTHFDDGRQRQDIFDGGQRIQTIVSDTTENNEHGWSQIVSDFDAAGVRTSKVTTFADGSSREETFNNGERLTILQTDASDEPWQEILSLLSSDGLVLTRAIYYDNGLARFETFEGGILAEMVQSDAPDLFDWVSITWTYSAEGEIVQSETIFDTGDISVMQYENGVRASRVDLDADESEYWQYRVTNYENGDVLDVTTYLEGDEFEWQGDIPEPLEPWLGDGANPNLPPPANIDDPLFDLA